MNERKPPLLLLENVLGFLKSHDGHDFEIALQAINNLGYSVDSFILDAARFVPQSRQRLFIVGILNNPNPTRTGVSISDVRPKDLVAFIREHPSIQWGIRHLPPLPQSREILSSILEDLAETSPEWWSLE